MENVTFIFVNDGSSDNTATLLLQLQEISSSAVHICHLPENKGKGEAVRTGFMYAFSCPFQYVGFWDADLATPLSSITKLLIILKQKKEKWMVLGARIPLFGRTIHRRYIRSILSYCYKRFVRLLFGVKIYDPLCGAKIFRINDALRVACGTPFLTRWSFDVELMIRLSRLAIQRGENIEQKIYEEPLEKWTEMHNSKFRIRDFITVPYELLRLKFEYLPFTTTSQRLSFSPTSSSQQPSTVS